ncbi:MAG: hypothetical protein CMJ89_07695 [Planctomycetes bacterium]|nr:hypothetical protein [Planctomycetota bacterium]
MIGGLGEIGLIASLSLIVWSGTACGSASSHESESHRALLLADHRIMEFMVPCHNSGFFDRDTSDIVALLISKLEHGKTEPLKRAKEELGALGRDAAEQLDRFVDRNASDPMRAPLLQNGIDAVGFNLTDEAHQVLLKGLQHPQESVRRQALIGFAARHARPADFEILLERIEGFETAELRRIAVRAIFLADRERAERRVLKWLSEKSQRDLWINALPLLAETTDPEVRAACAALFDDLDPILAIHVAAPAAGGGDRRALAYLREMLGDETPQNLRTLAVQVLGKARLFDELDAPSHNDPDETVRIFALDAIATAEGLDDVAERIAHCMDDQSPQVRGLALKHLVALRHADARARALAMLSENGAILQAALMAIRTPMKEDEDFARLVLERLLERHGLEEHRPLQKRTATYKAMGLVPLAEASIFLHELGMAHFEEEIESLGAHDWLMIQASNTDRPGRLALIAALESATDPIERIDLIQAIGSSRDELAREALLELVGRGDQEPLELLFTASRLVRIGPSWIVAPALKRASYEVEDIEVRKALQCMLWHWY